MGISHACVISNKGNEMIRLWLASFKFESSNCSYQSLATSSLRMRDKGSLLFDRNRDHKVMAGDDKRMYYTIL